MISSYSSPYAFGHKALADLFDDGPIWVQEKVDGSQFSFGLNANGAPVMRSRRVVIDLGNTGMFEQAVLKVLDLATQGKLTPGWTYRCEFLAKPKHNTLRYARVPKGNLVLFDVDMGDQDYLYPPSLATVAQNLGIEAVPLLDSIFTPPTSGLIASWLQHESILGGTKIEGVVLKNYRQFGPDKKTLMAKIVSEDFKEVHSKDWKERHPNRADVVDQIIADYGSEALWRKAIQHLDEAGQLVNAPQDIGPLMREIAQDFEGQFAEPIGALLWQHFRRDILRGIQRGFPEFYKRELWLGEEVS